MLVNVGRSVFGSGGYTAVTPTVGSKSQDQNKGKQMELVTRVVGDPTQIDVNDLREWGGDIRAPGIDHTTKFYGGDFDADGKPIMSRSQSLPDKPTCKRESAFTFLNVSWLVEEVKLSYPSGFIRLILHGYNLVPDSPLSDLAEREIEKKMDEREARFLERGF